MGTKSKFIILVLIIGVVAWFAFSDREVEAPVLSGPSDEQAELVGYGFMLDFVNTASPSVNPEAIDRLYNSLSEKAKASTTVETLSRDMALFIGVQDVPDHGVSVEDFIISEDTASLIVGLNYSGGITLKSVNMVVENDLWKVDSVSPADDWKTSLEVPMDARYADKIVYTTSQDVDVSALQADCADKGGVFNECGTPCASDAEVCMTVCAFTCENLPQ